MLQTCCVPSLLTGTTSFLRLPESPAASRYISRSFALPFILTPLLDVHVQRAQLCLPSLRRSELSIVVSDDAESDPRQ